MAHGALGARLSCLLELNVIYTVETHKDEQQSVMTTQGFSTTKVLAH